MNLTTCVEHSVISSPGVRKFKCPQMNSRFMGQSNERKSHVRKIVLRLEDAQKEKKTNPKSNIIKTLAEKCGHKSSYQTRQVPVESLAQFIRCSHSSLCPPRLKMAESDILSRQVYVHGSTMLVRPTSPCPLTPIV